MPVRAISIPRTGCAAYRRITRPMSGAMAAIRASVRKHIGGDEQRIHEVDTAFRDITFKYLLLPIWIGTYNYDDKEYHMLVNGQTGKVSGYKPRDSFNEGNSE